jgi:hypothetical protein
VLASGTVVVTIIRQANLDRAVDAANYPKSLPERSARLQVGKVSVTAN